MWTRCAAAAALVFLFGSAAGAGFVAGRPLGTAAPFRDFFPTGPHSPASAPALSETFDPFANLSAAHLTLALTVAPDEGVAPPAIHLPETTAAALPAFPIAPPADLPGPARASEPARSAALPPPTVLVPRQDESVGTPGWRAAVLSRAFDAVTEGEDWGERIPAILAPGEKRPTRFLSLDDGQGLRPTGPHAPPAGEAASALSTGERTTVAALLSAFLAALIYTGRKDGGPA